MTISISGSRNYSATVIRVPKVRKAENSDRLYIIDVMGMTAIVGDSWVGREGELAVVFPAEVQLSHEYMHGNNLYRDKELNQNKSEAGYIETNRRVRAMKLRGNISNGLVMPLTSLVDGLRVAPEVSEGDVFDTVDGIELCRKYVVPVNASSAQNRADSKIKKAFKRVDNTFLPEHFETGQWLREEGHVQAHEELIITQKLHGTSCRLGNTVVKRQHTKREKLAAKFLGARIADHEYDLVGGSKKVIKDPNNPNQKHHYEFDIWSDALKMYGDRLPKNIVIYGELVGFVPGGGPIQQGHTYGMQPGNYELYVYRVAIITEVAELYDLSWDQVRDFCSRHGLKHVPELDRMPKAVFDVMDFNEVNFYEKHQLLKSIDNGSEYTDPPVRLSEGGTGADEGIAIRVERGLTPEIYKYKNKSHYEWETKELDTGIPDLESVG